MRKRRWLSTLMFALPLAAASLLCGWTLVRADQAREGAGYVCPLTGETLPCPDCCPAKAR